ncbi:DUF2721 domain-containing protein [bacterium]|nr:DUF2721 domain-containing protein [bacterium]
MLTLLQIILAPVVLISACGLLCLALYNRLSTIISRARAFHRELFDVQTQLARIGNSDEDVVAQIQNRIEILNGQTGQLIARAAQIRNAIACLLLTVVSMLVCSLLLAALALLADPNQIATGIAFMIAGPQHVVVYAAGCVFVLGILLMIAAMAFAITELSRALDPVYVEYHEMIEPETRIE